jgi:RNA polymerase sigma-70 factor (ECF subfamily)
MGRPATEREKDLAPAANSFVHSVVGRSERTTSDGAGAADRSFGRGATEPPSALGNLPGGPGVWRRKPMLDSPSLRIAVRRDPLNVEDLRSTTVADDPVQRRDLILIERARAGDLDAFNDLVVCYQDLLFALIVRMVPDRDQASDCVQEAFFSAYRNLAGFRGGSVKSWLQRIAVNAAMDMQRARKRRPVQPYPELDDESWQPPAGEEANPVTTALTTERHRALNEALATITDDQRAAIVLFDIEGYDYAEIATMTGVSLGTVKSRIHRGRLALRDRLAGRMELFRG